MYSTNAPAVPAPLVSGLNDEQRRAVTTTDGPLLIVAGPGSGKTRVLTSRVAYLIGEHGVAPWNIMAVTFTNKAAREMRERVEHLVGDRARWITIGTFHAVCARILRQHGEAIGVDPRFVIYDDSDQMGVVKTAMESLDINTRNFSPRAVLSIISRAKSHNIDSRTFADTVETYFEEIVARVYPAYEQTLRRRRALDFDDLLSDALRLIQSSDEVRRTLRDRHRYILVDEYQDTNRIQYLLVKELSSTHRNLCVVGDPDQSIYGWRAADIRNILTFKDDYPEAIEVHLEENYRSTPQVLAAADAVIRENVQRIERGLRTSNPSGEAIVVRQCFDEIQEAQFIVDELTVLRNTHRYSGHDIAVVYRTNWQSRPIEEAFIRAAIPYQLIGGTRFYERKEIKDSIALLRLICNPDDMSAFERIVAEYPLGDGIGSKSLADLEDWCRTTGRGLDDALSSIGAAQGPPLSSRAAKLFGSLHLSLSRLRDIEPEMPLSAFFDHALRETGYSQRFESGDPEMSERGENVRQFRANLERFDAEPDESRLTTFLSEVALVSDADTIGDDADKVTLITLHAVKGLEFAVVFVTGVEEGLIPHQRSISENPAMIEEERRLFYVGITRAKERLYLTHAFRRTRFGGSEPSLPSSFLASIPASVIADPPRRDPEQQPVAKWLSVEQTSSPPAWTRVASGQRVFHAKFGDGVVADVVDRGDDQEVTVEFNRHGQKRLMASMANLTVG
ncbi:MAG TPA: UvrD-helicase domain-containing protein [Thermomicrobiales bacterium]|nr:UvrD-helicase domain-containing protein [Thermomicrobiales bacterium]